MAGTELRRHAAKCLAQTDRTGCGSRIVQATSRRNGRKTGQNSSPAVRASLSGKTMSAYRCVSASAGTIFGRSPFHPVAFFCVANAHTQQGADAFRITVHARPRSGASIVRSKENGMKIRALVVEQKDAPFVLHELDLEEPGRGEVLVRIVACGVCHTDA